MYQSRIHFDYGDMHIAFDPLTGEILELFHTRTKDNLLKNSMYAVHQPFTLRFAERQIFPVHSREANKNPALRVNIFSDKQAEGLRIYVRYPFLSDGKSTFPADLEYTVLLRQDEAVFRIHFTNTFGEEVREVDFPVLPGIYLGRDWTDNTLIFPEYAGMKYKNPVGTLTQPLKHLNWRWQEYRYDYILEGSIPKAHLAERGLKGVSGRYPGELSMSWFDLYNKDGGVYFACHDPSSKPCTLEVGAFGDDFPGLVFSLSKDTLTSTGETYNSPDCVLRIHEGDWHAGADIYREFRRPTLQKAESISPDWAKKSVCLFAHYDFKYQNGGVVHTYKDLPRLAEEAKKAGSDHILLAGWHKDGFDNGFPQYVTDPDLGTEYELTEGIRKAKQLGVHVSVYVNARLFNTRYAASENDLAGSIKDREGNIEYAHFGNADLLFANMCPGSETWQDSLSLIAENVLLKYGCDGIYFDVLSVRGSLCFNSQHSHEFDDFCEGNKSFLLRIRKEQTSDQFIPVLMGEHVCDQLGGILTFQLNQLFLNYSKGGFPAMYRFTFPEHRMMDMVYPEINLAMRPTHVSAASKEFMGILFKNDCYFWIYDLVDDNTFTRDPDGFALLRSLISFQKQLHEEGNFTFVDTIGFTCSNENSVMVSRFVSNENNNVSMLRIFRLNEAEAEITFLFPVKRAELLLPNTRKPVIVKTNRITVPPEKFCAILLYSH